MRTITHPGPTPATTHDAHTTRFTCTTVVLAAGKSLHDALIEVFATLGSASGYAEIQGVQVNNIHYVFPALSPDDKHAVWYSDEVHLSGECFIERAGMVLGDKDGEPFIHCHGLWSGADGERRMGHLFTKQSTLIAPVLATLYVAHDAIYQVREDEQTNFSLFKPVSYESNCSPGKPLFDATRQGVLASIRPNQDLGHTALAIAREKGFAKARVFGVGSFVGVEFADGHFVDSIATEALIKMATIDTLESTAEIDIALVDINSTIYEGVIKPQQNPVCVTFEALIIEI